MKERKERTLNINNKQVSNKFNRKIKTEKLFIVFYLTLKILQKLDVRKKINKIK